MKKVKKLNHDLDVLYLMGGQLTNEMFELSSKIKETKIELFKSFYNYLDNHDGNFTTEDLKYKNPHETMEEFREKYLVTIKMKMLDYISQLEAMEDPNEIIAF